jgi:preprotein translocase subunit SecG
MDDDNLHWSERAKLSGGSSIPEMPRYGEASRLNRRDKSFWNASWSRKSLARVTVALIVVFAVAGIGVPVLHAANGGERSGSAGDPSQQVALYKDTGAGFSFQYPSSWVKEPYHSAMANQVEPIAQVTFADPAGAVSEGQGLDFIMVAVVETPIAFTEAMRPSLISGLERYLAAIEAQVPGFELVQPATEFTTNGLRGVTATISCSLGDRTVVSSMYFLPVGHLQYQMSVQASQENWATDKPLFDAAVQSFQVGDRM